MGCCVCKNPVADAHHLRIVGHKRGMSIKNGDQYTIPLCRKHHEELHNFGDENLFLSLHGINWMLILNQINGEDGDDIRGEDEGEAGNF